MFSNGFRSIGNLPNLTPAFVVDVGIVSYNPGPVERERERERMYTIMVSGTSVLDFVFQIVQCLFFFFNI